MLAYMRQISEIVNSAYLVTDHNWVSKVCKHNTRWQGNSAFQILGGAVKYSSLALPLDFLL